ncbi:MAG: glycosyltransferase family 39 protein [bacterium]|nr:glycosyltransferase family 39 protein [bacterium]
MAALLVVVFLLPFLSMQNFSPISDEITHLPSGYSYLKTGEIKLNPQHPPLIKILAALPLLFLDLKFDRLDPSLVGPQASEWQFGRNFLSNNGVDRVIFWGRIPMILLSVLLGWYVYKWGKELFGYRAGLIGLFIYALMPNLIAHAQFVATDMGLTVFSFISIYYFWRLLKAESGSIGNLVLTGVFLGLALGSKFSAIFLLPIFPILLMVYFIKKPGVILYKFNSLLKIILPIYGFAFLVVWALYFFPSDPLFYWKGLNTVYTDNNPTFEYYLNGSFKNGGWWYYFLEAFIIKTPTPFLVALFASLIFYKKSGLNFLSNLFILLPATIFLVVASWKAHNIGVRYILSIYPFLILFVSGWLATIVKSLRFTVKSYSLKFLTLHFLLLALFVWYVFSSISVYPDYLAYFNELVGGSNNGYKYLDDSNVDWGYDLKRLAQYQESNPDLQVVYTWDTFTGASKMYGIKNTLPINLQAQWLVNPSGKYAINVHALIRLKLASQKYENDRLNWRDLYNPTDRIGQSFFIYEFP